MKGGVFMSEPFDDRTVVRDSIGVLSVARERGGTVAHYKFEIDILGDIGKALDGTERTCNRDELTDGVAHF